MLPKDNQLQETTPITPKLRLIYTDFKFVTQTTSYKVFQAKSCYAPFGFHIIRALDTSSEFVKNDFNVAATLFIKELLRLYSLYPDHVLIDTFESSEDGRRMAYAVLPYTTLSQHVNNSTASFKKNDVLDPRVIQKLLRDSLTDIEFIRKNISLISLHSILDPNNICYIAEKNAFFLSNWSKTYENDPEEELSTSSVFLSQESLQKTLTSQEISKELSALALTVLKIDGIDCKDLELFIAASKNPLMCDAGVKGMVVDAFKNSEYIKDLMIRMLSKDPLKLPRLKEIRNFVVENHSQEEEKLDNGAGASKKNVNIKGISKIIVSASIGFIH